MDQENPARAMLLIGHFLSCFDYISLEPYFVECIETCIEVVIKKDNPTIRNVFLHNVGIALYKNKVLTLQVLQNKGILDTFLSSVVQYFKESASYAIQKAAFLGLISLYSLPQQDLMNLTK